MEALLILLVRTSNQILIFCIFVLFSLSKSPPFVSMLRSSHSHNFMPSSFFTQHLHESIQDQGLDGHDSFEDARVALDLALLKVIKWLWVYLCGIISEHAVVYFFSFLECLGI